MQKYWRFFFLSGGCKSLIGFFSGKIWQNVDVLVLIEKFMEFPFQLAWEHLYFVKSCLNKNQLKISIPPKKHQYFYIFTHLYPLLPRLYWIWGIPKILERHILSNGPHLVSPQEAQKITKTQNKVTVEPYFWSLIDCHPVCITTHQSFKGSHNYALHYFILLSSPCM